MVSFSLLNLLKFLKNMVLRQLLDDYYVSSTGANNPIKYAWQAPRCSSSSLQHWLLFPRFCGVATLLKVPEGHAWDWMFLLFFQHLFHRRTSIAFFWRLRRDFCSLLWDDLFLPPEYEYGEHSLGTLRSDDWDCVSLASSSELLIRFDWNRL